MSCSQVSSNEEQIETFPLIVYHLEEVPYETLELSIFQNDKLLLENRYPKDSNLIELKLESGMHHFAISLIQGQSIVASSEFCPKGGYHANPK